MSNADSRRIFGHCSTTSEKEASAVHTFCSSHTPPSKRAFQCLPVVCTLMHEAWGTKAKGPRATPRVGTAGQASCMARGTRQPPPVVRRHRDHAIPFDSNNNRIQCTLSIPPSPPGPAPMNYRPQFLQAKVDPSLIAPESVFPSDRRRDGKIGAPRA